MNKRYVLLFPKENSDLTNTVHMEKNLNVSEISASLELDVLRRCNSLPIFITNNMYCDWKKKSTNCVQTRYISRDIHRQSTYLTDGYTFNFDPSNTDKETKSIQELQTEVDALIQFRNIVIETFPDLKTKMMSMCSAVSSKRNQSKTKKIRRKAHACSNAEENSVIGAAEVTGEAISSFVSRSRSNSNCCRKEPKSAEGSGSTVQDSGFSTETTSSKDGYSAPGSSGGLQGTTISDRLLRDSDDELLNLLDVIFRKTLRFRQKYPSMPHFECEKNGTYVSSACIPNILNSSSLHPRVLRYNTNYSFKQNLLRLNNERDKLLSKVAELETEIIKNRIKISKMETKLEFLTSGNKNLEEQLKAALNQNQELNFELFQRKCDSASREYIRSPPTLAVKRQRKSCVQRQYSKLVTPNINEGTCQISSKTISENNPDENDRSQQSATFDRVTSEFNINSENIQITNNMRDLHPSTLKLNPDLGCKSSKNDIQSLGKLDGILNSPKSQCKVREVDSNKIAAILLEKNPLKLQRHLLTLTVENQAKRFYPEHRGQKSIPPDLKKKSPKLSLHQTKNTSDYRYDCNNSCFFKQLNNGEKLQYDNVDSVEGENSIDSIRSHDDKIQNECDKTIQPAKRLKPSKIPLFGSKSLHSSKAIYKSLSLSTGNIYFKNSRFNQQDSLTLKIRGSSSSVAADSKIVSTRSALLKKKRDLETDRPFQLNSLSKSKKSYKTNEHIQTDNKTGLSTNQNKHSNALITFPSRGEIDKNVNNISEGNLSRKDTKTTMKTETKIGYLTQPGVQLLIGGISKSSYRSSITNSSNNNSMAEDEQFTDENIGRVRNLRSTLLGWLKI